MIKRAEYGFVASGCTFEDTEDSKVVALKYAQYIYGSTDSKVYNCNPHWGDENYYYGVEFVNYNPLGFTIGSGSIWIFVAGAVVILGGVAAIVFASKKKHL